MSVSAKQEGQKVSLDLEKTADGFQQLNKFINLLTECLDHQYVLLIKWSDFSLADRAIASKQEKVIEGRVFELSLWVKRLRGR